MSTRIHRVKYVWYMARRVKQNTRITPSMRFMSLYVTTNLSLLVCPLSSTGISVTQSQPPSCVAEMSDLDTKWVKIGIIWYKSGILSDHISVHFGSASQNVLKSDLKKSWVWPIWDQSDPILNQI